jgi:uncharacterized repeat protein (TIGR02543 family)
MRRIYQTLKDRSFTDDNIYWFNFGKNIVPGTTQELAVDDTTPTSTKVGAIINGTATFAGGQTLADRMNTNPAPLYIIMVDHGSPNAFHLDGNDTITPDTLNDWLNTLDIKLSSGAASQQKTIIIGACYSGSFISKLSGTGRTIITSASPTEVSYMGVFDNQDTFQSGEYFLDELFSSYKALKDTKTAFKEAAAKTWDFTRKNNTGTNSTMFASSAQHPMINDSGSGKGSIMPSDGKGDGFVSTGKYLGKAPGINSLAFPADLSAVADTIFLTDAQTSLLQVGTPLWATAIDNNQVSSVWVELRRPDITLLNPADVVTGQLSRNLNPSDKQAMNPVNGRFEYSGFTFDQPGKYEVFYYAIDKETGKPSPSKRSLVYKGKTNNNAPASPLLTEPKADGTIPDPFIANAWINPGTTLTFRWEAATDPDSDPVSYILELCKGANCTYYTDIPATGYQVSGLTHLADYTWKIWAVDPWGGHTASLPRSFKAMDSGADTVYLQGYIYDESYNPVRASVSVVNVVIPSVERVAVADTDGSFRITLGASGSYNMTVSHSDYTTSTQSISVVPQGIITVAAQNVSLTHKPPAAGVCGGAHTKTFTIAPSIDLCSPDASVTVSPSVTGWTWSCPGQYGGGATGCWAYKPHTLSVSVTGDGTVNRTDVANFTCDSASSPCTSPAVNHGVQMTLRATPGISVFDGWTGACANKLVDCTVTMDTDGKTLTASFIPHKPFQVNGTDVNNLQDAYNQVNVSLIKIMSGTWSANSSGPMLADQNKTVTLEGGYGADYVSPDPNNPSIIAGGIRIKAGKIIIKNVKIQ